MDIDRYLDKYEGVKAYMMITHAKSMAMSPPLGRDTRRILKAGTLTCALPPSERPQHAHSRDGRHQAMVRVAQRLEAETFGAAYFAGA